MHKIFGLLILFSSLSMAQLPHKSLPLQAKIDSLLKESEGTFAVAFKDLQTSQEFFVNATESFHAASTMKTPVMIEVFNQEKQGAFSLNDSVLVVNSFTSIVDGTEYSLRLSDDSDDGLYQYLGKKETIRSLLFKMITVSSNLSTNILIEKIGAKNIMKTMRQLGLNDINVLRGVEDDKAFNAGLNNTTTAKDLMILYEGIANKTIVSEEACNEMLDILSSQKFRSMIPALLPDNVRVAHKTGSITNVQHDSGIIFLPDGRRYVLIILSKGLRSNKNGIEVISKLSKIIYDYMMG